MTIKEKIKIYSELRKCSDSTLVEVVEQELRGIRATRDGYYWCGSVIRKGKALSMERSWFRIQCASKLLRKDSKSKAKELARNWIVRVMEGS